MPKKESTKASQAKTRSARSPRGSISASVDQVREPRNSHRPTESSSFFLIKHPETDAGSGILATIGGIAQGVYSDQHALGAMQRLGKSIDATIARLSTAQFNTVRADSEIKNPRAEDLAEPPPSDVLAMFRLVDYICRTTGDVAQTVAVPVEILSKPIHFACDDEAAQKIWETLFRETLDIDELYEEILLEVEQNFNCFPLEIWNSGSLQGISFLEPTSMWVGRHFGADSRYGLLVPSSFASKGTFDQQKLNDMIHPLAYSSFVTDLNVQTSRWFRVPIKIDAMTPVYGRKMAYQRYAIPDIARAARNVMHRQILDELRRGTMEGYINQILVATVGSDTLTPNQNKNLVSVTHSLLNAQASERTGTIVGHHSLKMNFITPAALDKVMGDDTRAGLTQDIFCDLGFSKFLVSGELPGSAGRGGGLQVENDVQFAIERWGYKQRNVLKWFTQLAKKYAQKNDKSLLKHLPIFKVDPIGIQQTQMIKERLMPMAQGGHLDEHTILEQAGFNFNEVLANKKAEKKYAELFLPKPSFNQMATDKGGNTTEKSSPPGGRPTDAQRNSAGRTPKQQALKAEAEELADEEDDLQAYRTPSPSNRFLNEIDLHFDKMVASNGTEGGSQDRVNEFTLWLQQALLLVMAQSCVEGFNNYGGLGEIDAKVLATASQGTQFHMNALAGFADELNSHAGDLPGLLALRYRALLYGGAAHTAYMLGVQQAMQTQGATGWQRVLHPELTASGPCDFCTADSVVVHPITEPFWEPHPNGACAPQSVNFNFGFKPPESVGVPDYGMPTQHTTLAVPVR